MGHHLSSGVGDDRKLALDLDRAGRETLQRELAAAAEQLGGIERAARARIELGGSAAAGRVSVAIVLTSRADAGAP